MRNGVKTLRFHPYHLTLFGTAKYGIFFHITKHFPIFNMNLTQLG